MPKFISMAIKKKLKYLQDQYAIIGPKKEIKLHAEKVLTEGDLSVMKNKKHAATHSS